MGTCILDSETRIHDDDDDDDDDDDEVGREMVRMMSWIGVTPE
jgi:hypothetical protein